MTYPHKQYDRRGRFLPPVLRLAGTCRDGCYRDHGAESVGASVRYRLRDLFGHLFKDRMGIDIESNHAAPMMAKIRKTKRIRKLTADIAQALLLTDPEGAVKHGPRVTVVCACVRRKHDCGRIAFAARRGALLPYPVSPRVGGQISRNLSLYIGSDSQSACFCS